MQGWNSLTSLQQLQQATEQSFTKPVLLFKHSTRCNISTMAYNRLQRSTAKLLSKMDCYYLDLIVYRGISNHIAEQFQVVHQSPQVLLIKEGECIFDESHGGIDPQELMELA